MTDISNKSTGPRSAVPIVARSDTFFAQRRLKTSLRSLATSNYHRHHTDALRTEWSIKHISNNIILVRQVVTNSVLWCIIGLFQYNNSSAQCKIVWSRYTSSSSLSKQIITVLIRRSSLMQVNYCTTVKNRRTGRIIITKPQHTVSLSLTSHEPRLPLEGHWQHVAVQPLQILLVSFLHPQVS